MKFGLKQLVASLFATVLVGVFAGCGSDQSNDPLKASGVTLNVTSMNYTTATNITGSIEATYALDGNATVSGLTASVEGCTTLSSVINNGDAFDVNSSSSRTVGVNIVVADGCNGTNVSIHGTETTSEGIDWALSTSATVSLLSGGGGGTATSPIVSISPLQPITVTTNNEVKTVTLRVFGEGGSIIDGGTITVGYPAEYIAGQDVGYFKENKVTVVDGRATFTYVGPSDIYNIVNTLTNISFSFFDTLNAAGTSTSLTVNFEPDTTIQPPLLTGYTIDFVDNNNKATLELNSTSVFTVSVKNDKGDLVLDENILSLTITSLDPARAILVDSTNSDVPSLTFNLKNDIPMTIKTNTVSGQVMFDILLDINDSNGNRLTKTITKSVVVFSGPPTAMSISYAYTDQNETTKRFIEHMNIAVTDKWNNPVNTNPLIYVGAIGGYATDPASTVGNNFAVDLVGTATVDSSSGAGTSAQMTASKDFSAFVTPSDDTLMTFGRGYVYQGSGKWDISNAANGQLDLVETYTASSASTNMGYAIGHNYREDICNLAGGEWILNTDSADGTYRVDNNGIALVNINYDALFVGHTIIVGATTIGTLNGSSETIRLGESRSHTLRGLGFDGARSFTIPTGGAVTVGMNVHIKDTGYNAKNVFFDYVVTSSDTVTISATNDSMSVGGIYSCENNGIAYVEVTASSSGTAGTVTISVVEDRTNSEF